MEFTFYQMELFSHYRKDVLSVNDSYVYDDGDESLGIDTFEREPYIVRFQSSFTGQWKKDHVLMKKISFSNAFLYKKKNQAQWLLNVN